MMPQAVTGYKDFYKRAAPTDNFIFLRKYPTDIIIMVLSRINALIYQERGGKFSLLKKILTECFPLLDEERKGLLGQEIGGSPDEEMMPTIFSSQSISKLISFCFENYYYEDTDKQVNTTQFQQDLWDNILLVNQIYYTQVGGNEDLTTYEVLWKLGMMQQYYIRKFDYVGLTGQVNVLLFYKFLKYQFPNGPALIAEFIQTMGITGFFDYALISLEFISSTTSAYEKEKMAKWAVTFTETQLKMVEHFSIRPTHFTAVAKKSNVHRDIMTHPFYFLLNEHPVILDFDFLAYMAEFSLTYNFYHFTSLNNSQAYKTFTAFKTMLGKFYHEEFTTGQLLNGIFSGNQFTIHDDKQSYFSDYSVVHNDKDIFLFEVKSSEISINVLERCDANQLKEFLNSQFAATSKTDGRNKGIYQLLTSIGNFSSTQRLDSLVHDPSRKNKCTIYPIIIYTENVMDIAGVNAYLNDIFQNEQVLSKLTFKKIQPVTLINLTTLIENYGLLKTKPTLLKKWITDYWERCNSNKKSFDKSKHPYQFLRAGNSFENYIREINKENDKLENFRVIVQDLKLKDDE